MSEVGFKLGDLVWCVYFPVHERRGRIFVSYIMLCACMCVGAPLRLYKAAINITSKFILRGL